VSDDREPAEDAPPGAGIVNLAWAGTGAFVAVAVAGVLAPDGMGPVVAGVSLVLFAIGCVAFLWSYAVAVGRSRYDQISIAGLYFLQGSAPPEIRRRLLIALAVQVVAAVAAASIRPFTSVAFGVLVPVFGLGLCGLWAARYGTFEHRPTQAG
jgi:hypothetical protein